MRKTTLSYCEYCKIPKHQCQCTSGEWLADWKQINLPCQDCMSGSGLCQKHKVDNCTGCSGIEKCNYCLKITVCKDVPRGQDTVYIHSHSWSIDKLAGFIKVGIEGVYIVCRSCGEVRLMEVNTKQ